MHYVLCKIGELGSVTSWSCRVVVLLSYSNLFLPFRRGRCLSSPVSWYLEIKSLFAFSFSSLSNIIFRKLKFATGRLFEICFSTVVTRVTSCADVT